MLNVTYRTGLENANNTPFGQGDEAKGTLIFLERFPGITIKTENLYTLLVDLQPTVYHSNTIAQVNIHVEKALPHIRFLTVKTKKTQKIT